MIIRSLELYNIRSYSKAHIRFPEGSVLLSGDIGSGKSSILVAIEFAFFGIKRGDIPGSALLRHGEKEGHVMLNLELGEHEVIIKRTLKRNKYGVKQDSGFVVVDGVKTEGTPEELKAKVLELLGYPKDLLKKGKDLVFRFTVYTPQEQMKSILFEGKEERLNTLRKVFGIDKYKRIRENAALYISELKSRKRNLEGKTYGLDEKIEEREKKVKEGEEIKKKIDELKPKVDTKKQEVENFKKSMQEDEKKIQELNDIKNRIKVIDTQLMEKFLSRRKTKEKIDSLYTQVKEMEAKGINSYSDQDYSKTISEKRQHLKTLEKEYNDMYKSLGEYDSYINASKRIIEKISNLNECPTCEQEVTKEHKNTIESRENNNISKYEEKKKEIKERLEEKNNQIKKVNDEIQELQNKEKKNAIERERVKTYNEKKEQIKNYENELQELKKQIGELNSEKLEKNNSLKGYENVQERYQKAKEELDALLNSEKELENELATQNAYLNENKKTIELYDKEIREKKEFKKEIKKITQIQNWLDEHFLNLMSTIEKNVMAQLYKEFNELFIEWFRVLIEDETLNVRLDDQFTPIIEQNGFETDISYLSGGEKTSVALAYRLALNKVINDFIRHMKTRDVIILDEPTDGFSDEQLDNVRDVLEQLNMKQVIIVSHESKIESFVDNVIRVSKNENTSKIS